jgi:hypothetical protein
MPHIVKISQRRKGSGAQVRFQSRSFIDSDTSEKVDGTRRIQWTAWIGFGGRHASDYAGDVKHTDFGGFPQCGNPRFA